MVWDDCSPKMLTVSSEDDDETAEVLAALLLIVRSSHEQVLKKLGTRTNGVLVGPTSAAGWTAVWSYQQILRTDGFSDSVTIAERGVGLVVGVAGPEGHHRCTLTPETTVTADVRDVAAALCRLFDAKESESDVLRTLADADLAEDYLAEDLDAFLDLPPLLDSQSPTRAIVLHQGDPQSVLLAARMIGRVFLTQLETGWTAVFDADDPGNYLGLGRVVGVASSKRRDAVIALWRRTSDVAGYAVFRGEDITASGSWNTGWTEARDHQADHQAVIDLAQRLSGGNADVVALRSLLRASSWPSDPLVELVSLVGIGTGALDVLDSQTRRSSAQLVAPRSPVRAWWEMVKGSGAELAVPSWLMWTHAVGTAIAALVCFGMTGLGAGIVLTDGAFIDQESARTEDWIFTLVFLALALILAPAAVGRLRRASAEPPQSGQGLG